jgi:hypothetical protein
MMNWASTRIQIIGYVLESIPDQSAKEVLNNKAITKRNGSPKIETIEVSTLLFRLFVINLKKAVSIP